ncbi:MAG: hypothetical protein M1826_003809 [Phylliscum demangeonii]|nr:MAG: hypothetical protein M1826_003809 [Phylliscum demangeonii]
MSAGPRVQLLVEEEARRPRDVEGGAGSGRRHAATARGFAGPCRRRPRRSSGGRTTIASVPCVPSDSVLGLGCIADATARAIVFQNYESPLTSSQVARDVRLATIEVAADFERKPLRASVRASADDG